MTFLSLDELDEGGAEGGGGGLLAVGMRGRRRGRDGGGEAVEVLVDRVGGVVGGALVRFPEEFQDHCCTVGLLPFTFSFLNDIIPTEVE